jgi:hypothetical protein
MKKLFTGQATYEQLCVEARARKFPSWSDYIEKLLKHLQLLFNLGSALASRCRANLLIAGAGNRFAWAGHLFARAGHAWSISARFASVIASLACAASFFTIITALILRTRKPN